MENTREGGASAAASDKLLCFVTRSRFREWNMSPRQRQRNALLDRWWTDWAWQKLMTSTFCDFALCCRNKINHEIIGPIATKSLSLKLVSSAISGLFCTGLPCGCDTNYAVLQCGFILTKVWKSLWQHLRWQPRNIIDLIWLFSRTLSFNLLNGSGSVATNQQKWQTVPSAPTWD